MRWSWILVFASAALIGDHLTACPFCNSSGTTLAQEAASAGLIIFGTPKNARLDPNDVTLGSTDLVIEMVIKSHPFLGDKKVINIPKYLPSDPKNPVKYLIFCDIYKGQLDPYRGTPFKGDSRIGLYLKGALACKDKPIADKLHFYFDFLDDSDPEIANDALTEFGNVDYRAFRPVAEKMNGVKIAKWLKDPATPASRLGLYGSMLGHCGKPEDFAILKAVLDDPNRRFTSGIDGVLAGMAILSPKEGWKTVSDILTDPKADFQFRYAAIRTGRFMWEFRPDVVNHEKVAAAYAKVLEQPDLADLAIEDMRKWSYWKLAPQVLGLLNQPGFDTVIMRRSVLRYALSCPAAQSAAAVAFVAAQRQKNAEWVKEVESFLASESVPLAPPPAPPPAKRGK